MTEGKREFFREQDYFDRQIAVREGQLADLQEKLSQRGPYDTVAPVLSRQLTGRFKMMVCVFSQGSPIDRVHQLFHKVLDDLGAYISDPASEPFELNHLDDYYMLVTLASLAVLLEADHESYEMLAEAVDYGGQNAGKDALLEFLLAQGLPDRSTTKDLVHSEPFGELMRVVWTNDEDERIIGILQFLESYNLAMESLSWFDSHFEDDGRFFGYWSFELAAVAKIEKIDDTMFAYNMYYPRDLMPGADHDPFAIEPVEIPKVEIPKIDIPKSGKT